MSENTGLFNRQFAENLIPLPAFQAPEIGGVAPDFTFRHLFSFIDSNASLNRLLAALEGRSSQPS